MLTAAVERSRPQKEKASDSHQSEAKKNKQTFSSNGELLSQLADAQPHDQRADGLAAVEHGHGHLHLLQTGGVVDFDVALPVLTAHRLLVFGLALVTPVGGLAEIHHLAAVGAGDERFGHDLAAL